MIHRLFLTFAMLAIAPSIPPLHAFAQGTAKPSKPPLPAPAPENEDETLKLEPPPSFRPASPEDEDGPMLEAPPAFDPGPPLPKENEPLPADLPQPVMVPAPAPMTVRRDAPAKFKPTDIVISADGKSVQLTGTIGDGMANRLKGELLKNPNVKTLILSSDGGLLIEGVALAHIVRNNGLNTHVEFFCGSACTLPLLAGKERSMAAGALIGFHQASTALGPLLGAQNSADEPGNILLRTSYAEAKLGAPLIDGALETPPTDMWFPDIATLSANGVITRLAKDGEFSLTSSEWKSPKEFRDALAADPLWKAARTARPEDYAYASGFGWMMASRMKDKALVMRAARVILQRRILGGAHAYPDALLGEYLDIEADFWIDSLSPNNRDCSIGTGSGMGFPVSNPEPGKLRDQQLAVLQKMMAIPAKRQQPDQTTRAVAQAQVMNFWGRMISEQSFGTYSVGTNFCREPLSYYEEMAKMPLADRASLMRALILTQGISIR